MQGNEKYGTTRNGCIMSGIQDRMVMPILVVPSDGFNMSTTALDVRKTRRIQPLVENPAINMLRLKQSDSVFYASPVSVVIPKLEMENWTIEKRKWKKRYIGMVPTRSL